VRFSFTKRVSKKIKLVIWSQPDEIKIHFPHSNSWFFYNLSQSIVSRGLIRGNHHIQPGISKKIPRNQVGKN
jgi:hypothetical protein